MIYKLKVEYGGKYQFAQYLYPKNIYTKNPGKVLSETCDWLDENTEYQYTREANSVVIDNYEIVKLSFVVSGKKEIKKEPEISNIWLNTQGYSVELIIETD